MHIAEDEETLLRQKIHALVGASPGVTVQLNRDSRDDSSGGDRGIDERRRADRFIGIT